MPLQNITSHINVNSFTGSATKKTKKVCFIPKEQWQRTKKNQIDWANSQAEKNDYKTATLEILRCFVACSDKDGNSHVSLNGIASKRSHLFPGHQPTLRTIQNHVAKLVAGGSILRSKQRYYKDSVDTVLVGYKELSCTQYENISYVYKSSFSNDHETLKKEPENVAALEVAIQSETCHEKLIEDLKLLDTEPRVAKFMITKAGLTKVSEALQYVMGLPSDYNKGAYLYRMIQNLGKPRIGDSKMIDSNDAQTKLRVNKTAVKYCEARGMQDPRLHRDDYPDANTWFDAIKQYDVMVSDEYVRLLNAKPMGSKSA